LTCSVTVAVWVKTPPVAVIVSVKLPVLVVESVPTKSVDDALVEPSTGFVLKFVLAPPG
jgi:hypothetical protein